jgi:VanZ family protein
LFVIFLAIVFLIVYGSLYPWQFLHIRLPANPLWILLHSWGGAAGDRRFMADVIVNIALYVPLGTSGYLAFRGRRLRIFGPLLIAALVSASVEMLQLYTPSRVCSALDLLNNILGSALGMAFGLFFEKLARPYAPEFGIRKLTDRPALALFFAWVGTLVFPLYPETHIPRFRALLSQFAHAPLFATVPFLSAAASWFVAGRLLTAAGFRHAGAWLAFSLLLLPAQFLIVSRHPSPVDFAGALAGFVLFLALGPRCATSGRAARILAWAFFGLILVRGLAPFHPGAAQPFVWVPFKGFLDMNWQSGILVLLEKIFYYGAAFWLLAVSGVRWHIAARWVILALAVIEALQTRLPGRVPEITEPLLGLLIVCGLAAISRRRQSDATLLPPVRR